MIQARRLSIRLAAFLILQMWLAATGAAEIGYLPSPVSFDPSGDGFAVAPQSGYVRFDPASGLIKWHYPNSNAYSSRRILVGGDKVFIANSSPPCTWMECPWWGEAALYCLDSATGAKKWAAAGLFDRLAMDAEGRLFAEHYSTGPGSISRLDPETGQIIWTQRGHGPIAIALNGYVIANNGAQALDPSDGRVVWAASERSLENPLAAISADGAIIQPGSSGTVNALDPETGVVRWRYIPIAPLHFTGSILASGQGTIVVPVSGGFTALDGRTGRMVWEQRMPYPPYNYDDQYRNQYNHQIIAGDGRFYALGGATVSYDLATCSSRRDGEGSGFNLSLSPQGLLYNYSVNRPVLDTRAPAPSAGWPSSSGDFRATASMQRGGPPSVAGEPFDVAWREGTNLFFSAALQGSAPMTQQWYLGENPLPGETNRALTISSASLPPGSHVHLRATNRFGSARTREALAGFEIRTRQYGQGSITQTPSNSIVAPGTTVRFEAEPPAHRTFKNWLGSVESSQPVIDLAVTQHVSLKAVFHTLPGDVLWKVDGSNFNGSSPIIDDDGFAYTLHTGSIIKWDLDTGERLLSISYTGGAGGGGDSLVDGKTFYSLDSGGVSAFNKDDGRRRWRYFGRPFHPSFADGKIIFREDNFLVALAGESGDLAWKTPLFGQQYQKPIGLSEGRLLLIDRNSSATIYNVGNGQPMTNLAVPRFTDLALPLADGDWALLGGYYQNTFSLLSNRLPPIQNGIRFYRTILSGYYPQVFVDSDNQTLAIDISDMRVHWEQYGTTHFHLADNSLICGQTLSARDAITGEEKWRASEQIDAERAVVSKQAVIFSVGRIFAAVQASAPLSETIWPSVDGDAARRRFPPKPTAPIFQAVPTSVVFSPGQPAKFQAVASGVGPIQYQWFADGAPIPGAKSNALVVPQPSAGPAPIFYTVQAADLTGSITSAPVVVGYSVDIRVIGGDLIAPLAKIAPAGARLPVRVANTNDRPFSHWEGDIAGTAPEVEITVTNNFRARAFFAVETGELLWKKRYVPDYLRQIFVTPDGEIIYQERSQAVALNAQGDETRRFNLPTNTTIAFLFGTNRLATAGSARKIMNLHGAALADLGATTPTHLLANGLLLGAGKAFNEAGQQTWFEIGPLSNDTMSLRGEFAANRSSSEVEVFSILTGRRQWQKPFPNNGGIYAINPQTLLVATGTNLVFVDLTTGNATFTITNANGLLAPRGILDGKGYWLASGSVVAGDLKTGARLWKTPFAPNTAWNATMESIFTEDGMLYFIASGDFDSAFGDFIAFDTAKQAVAFAYRPEFKSLVGLNMGPEGNLYVVEDNKHILCFQGSPSLILNMYRANPQGNHLQPLPRARFGRGEFSQNEVTLSFETTRFGQYAIESADDLSQPRWASLTNLVAQSTNTTTIVPGGKGPAFFRIKNLN